MIADLREDRQALNATKLLGRQYAADANSEIVP
jgi:hypothetical protein